MTQILQLRHFALGVPAINVIYEWQQEQRDGKKISIVCYWDNTKQKRIFIVNLWVVASNNGTHPHTHTHPQCTAAVFVLSSALFSSVSRALACGRIFFIVISNVHKAP